MIHVTGVDLWIDGRLRQRCAWCGALVLDFELTGWEQRPPLVWPAGTLVDVGDDGHSVPAAESGIDPAWSCLRLDPTVTR